MPLKRLLIAVDSGHGGSDPGACGNGLREADLTADFADRFAKLARAAGHQAILVGQAPAPDTCIPPGDRGRTAVAKHCNLLISFHINAASSLAHGFQVWYHGGDARSQTLAKRIHFTVTDAIPQWAGSASRIAADTERYASGFAVLRAAFQAMPAVLLEIGFISNRFDVQLLQDPMLKQATVIEILAALTASLAHGGP